MMGDRGDRSGIEHETLTHDIIEAVIMVHGVLGPGFVEAVYQRALLLELRKRNLPISAAGSSWR